MLDERALGEQIEQAFGHVDPPAASEMIQDVYKDSDDALEMVAAFRGKHWRELPLATLSHHREIVIALSGVGTGRISPHT